MKEAFIKLHISILIAGMTGVFGKLITLNEALLVWYRLLIASILFFSMLAYKKKLHAIDVHSFLKIAGTGCLLCLHWIFFYGSIKASNVSIGVVCFSLVGFFTALLEPILLKRRFFLSGINVQLPDPYGHHPHFPLRYPLPTRHRAWRCILNAGSPFHDNQQKSQCQLPDRLCLILRNDWRIHLYFLHPAHLLPSV